MELKKLSDLELNLLVAAYAIPKEKVIPHPRNERAAAIEYKYMPGLYTVFMPVQRPEDSFHLTDEDFERIKASIDSGFVAMPDWVKTIDDFDRWLEEVNHG